jgi:hypothetical protein
VPFCPQPTAAARLSEVITRDAGLDVHKEEIEAAVREALVISLRG